MNKYIAQWLEIIKNCNFDNTYKMSWAKALVEIALESDINEDTLTIQFTQIAEKCLKYYWNQTIFFDLIQGSNHKKIPEIMTASKRLIEAYQVAVCSYQPLRFEKAETNFDRLFLTGEYNAAIKSIVSTLKQDVCWRFKNVKNGTQEVYELDKKAGTIHFTSDQAHALRDYSELLFQVINYRWTQMLETFNTSPRISMKVRATHEPDGVRRGSLSKFHKHLDREWEDEQRICFHCGEVIIDDLSVDHVIPWSFMYSDDIWNLVYCHKGENSSKSNSIVSEEDAIRLEKRNKMLLKRFEQSDVKGKVYDELKLAVEHDYVRKFWIAAKGDQMSNRITYNKLVRDKIPQVIEATGKAYKTRIATEEEYKQLLLNKLLEEAKELKNDPCEEEVADVLEVIDTIVKLYNFDLGKINKLKEAKRDKRGGFEDRIILEHVIESEQNPIGNQRYYISGRPATFATNSEKHWKSLILDSLEGTMNSCDALRLNFNLSEVNQTQYAFDIDNLCEPVFSVLASKLGWYQGKRANIKSYIATKSTGGIEGLELVDTDDIVYSINEDQVVFDEVYTGKFPTKATDSLMIDWLDTKHIQSKVRSDCSIRLQFGSEKLSIATISSGKVKPIIDSLFPILGGQIGAPDDHKITTLIVEKSIGELFDDQVRITVWLSENKQ